MESIREMYKIGNGPSSSHTMGPAKAASIFKERNPAAASFHVTLYGSLAATGKGHLTDKAIIESLSPVPVEISWKASETIPPHPNGMTFQALDTAGTILQEWTTFSIGGGDISDSGSRESKNKVYEMSTMKEILEYCENKGCSFWEFVEEREGPGLWDYLGEVWQAMQEAISRGLETEGMFPGGLRVSRQGRFVLYHGKDLSGDCQPSSFGFCLCPGCFRRKRSRWQGRDRSDLRFLRGYTGSTISVQDRDRCVGDQNTPCTGHCRSYR